MKKNQVKMAVEIVTVNLVKPKSGCHKNNSKPFTFEDNINNIYKLMLNNTAFVKPKLIANTVPQVKRYLVKESPISHQKHLISNIIIQRQFWLNKTLKQTLYLMLTFTMVKNHQVHVQDGVTKTL